MRSVSRLRLTLARIVDSGACTLASAMLPGLFDPPHIGTVARRRQNAAMDRSSTRTFRSAFPLPASWQPPQPPRIDDLIAAADAALRTLSNASIASRPTPMAPNQGAMAAGRVEASTAGEMTDAERKLSGALMRVNHVGEVCAQALYQAQALTARTQPLRDHMKQAAREETDHLAWTKARLDALGDRPSLLNPLWYAGAFGIGLLAGALGDRTSLGFVIETERQVEEHLAGHLEHLPAADVDSRAVVAQMKHDEARHAQEALTAGGVEFPAPVKSLMRAAAKVMTTTARVV